jgi:hypothetical protein
MLQQKSMRGATKSHLGLRLNDVAEFHGQLHISAHLQLTLHKRLLSIEFSRHHLDKVLLLHGDGAVSLFCGLLFHAASRTSLKVHSPALGTLGGNDVELVDGLDSTNESRVTLRKVFKLEKRFLVEDRFFFVCSFVPKHEIRVE